MIPDSSFTFNAVAISESTFTCMCCQALFAMTDKCFTKITNSSLKTKRRYVFMKINKLCCDSILIRTIKKQKRKLYIMTISWIFIHISQNKNQRQIYSVVT